MNLGEKLKADTQRRKQLSAEQASLEKLEREALECAETRQNLAMVRAYFEFVKKGVTADIMAGIPPRSVPMDQRGEEWQLGQILHTYNWYGNIATITSPHHRYYGVWAEFDSWARDNGLKAKLEYQYDNGGVEAWRLVTVEPLK